MEKIYRSCGLWTFNHSFMLYIHLYVYKHSFPFSFCQVFSLCCCSHRHHRITQNTPPYIISYGKDEIRRISFCLRIMIHQVPKESESEYLSFHLEYNTRDAVHSFINAIVLVYRYIWSIHSRPKRISHTWVNMIWSAFVGNQNVSMNDYHMWNQPK